MHNLLARLQKRSLRSKRIIKKNYEFDRIYRKGKPYHSRELSLFLMGKKTKEPSRYAVTVSRKIRGAVQRNRVKRVLRALWQSVEAQVEDGYDLIILGRSEAEPGSFDRLQKQFIKLLKRAGIWSANPSQETLAENNKEKQE